VISDGKPSFQFQTSNLVQQLDDKGVQRFFVVVSDSEKSVNTIKKWASAPWETNLLHVPGIASLEADLGLWGQKALTLFCPMAISPSLMETQEAAGGFMRVKHAGTCGEKGDLLSTEVANAAACAALAGEAGAQSFVLGIWFRRGYCYTGTVQVDSAQYQAWQGERINPSCPAGDAGSNNGFTNSDIFDFYGMEPATD